MAVSVRALGVDGLAFAATLATSRPVPSWQVRRPHDRLSKRRFRSHMARKVGIGIGIFSIGYILSVSLDHLIGPATIRRISAGTTRRKGFAGLDCNLGNGPLFLW